MTSRRIVAARREHVLASLKNDRRPFSQADLRLRGLKEHDIKILEHAGQLVRGADGRFRLPSVTDFGPRAAGRTAAYTQLLERGGVVTWAQLKPLGLTAIDVQTMLDDGRLHEVRKGVFRAVAAPPPPRDLPPPTARELADQLLDDPATLDSILAVARNGAVARRRLNTLGMSNGMIDAMVEHGRLVGVGRDRFVAPPAPLPAPGTRVRTVVPTPSARILPPASGDTGLWVMALPLAEAGGDPLPSPALAAAGLTAAVLAELARRGLLVRVGDATPPSTA